MIRVLLLLPVLYLAWELLTIPYLSVALLEYRDPSDTALMRQRRSESANKGIELKIVHQWINLSRIPQHSLKAIVGEIALDVSPHRFAC